MVRQSRILTSLDRKGKKKKLNFLPIFFGLLLLISYRSCKEPESCSELRKKADEIGRIMTQDGMDAGISPLITKCYWDYIFL